MTDPKYKTLEERVAYLEAKLERQEKIEEQLKLTQDALTRVIHVGNQNFARLSGRISRKSDGLWSDLFNW
jgi:hypothetical protein